MIYTHCPRCGTELRDGEKLCYQCSLRAIARAFGHDKRDDVSISAPTSHSDRKWRSVSPDACEHLNSVGQDEYDRYCFDCNRVLVNYDR